MAIKPVYQKTFLIAGLVIALALLFAGSVRSYKVYDADNDEFGILTFHKVTDRLLVIDATFRGVICEEDKLYTTYDRLQPKGKRACPT